MKRLPFSVALATAVALPVATLAQTVTVERGDSLSSIAARELGSPNRWRDLCEFNQDVLGENCDLIIEGSVLRLSADAVLDASDAEPEVAEAPLEDASADAAEPASPEPETPVEDTAGDAEASAEDGTDTAEAAPEAPADDATDVAEADAGADAATPPVAAEEDPAVETADADAESAPAADSDSGSLIPINIVANVPLAFRGPDPYQSVEDGPNGGVVLSGHVEGAPSNGRPGIFATVPTNVEEVASGSRIEIAVTLFSDPATQAAVAYSTNEVGNSGWRSISATPQGARSAFIYTVREMNVGQGDYIGLLPDPNGTGQTVEVTDITITILGED